jgi:hypothetical protein
LDDSGGRIKLSSFIGDMPIGFSDAASFSIDTAFLGSRVILSKQSVTKCLTYQDAVRETFKPLPIWAPFGWAAILRSILAGAILFTNNLHSLPSHIGEFCASVLLLPAGLAFVLLGAVPGDFLAWLSGFPEWLLFALMVLGAYFYSLVLMMLIWVMIRLAKRGIGARAALSSH